MPRVALAAAVLVLAAHSASAQFSSLEANPTSEQAWAAVLEARKHFDGAAHEEHAHGAYLLFTQKPELLHSRFLNGDARAIVLLQDVFIEGTWVLHDAEGGDDAETKRIRANLESFVSGIESLKPERHEYDRLAMHEAFLGRARQLLNEWPEKRAALVRLR